MPHRAAGAQETHRRQPWRGAASASGPSKISQNPRTRLPWLDGNRSRQGSVPAVPGAFIDEASIANPPNATVPGVAEPDQNVPPSPDKKGPTIIANARKKRGAGDPVPTTVSPPDSIRSDGDVPEIPTTESKPPYQQQTVKVTSSRPAMPLIALARELYQTDSGGVSDSETERSLRNARRRTLGDPRLIPEPELPPNAEPQAARLTSSNYSLQGRASRFTEDRSETPSTTIPTIPTIPQRPTEDKSPKIIPETLSMNSTEHKPFVSVQPIRSRKVTIMAEDVSSEARAKRRQSLSVQPLRKLQMSRSFDEDLSSDFSKKRRHASTASCSPAEKGLYSSLAGLEDLMQEALRLAKDAAEHGRSNEIPTIMEEARLALHTASGLQHGKESPAPYRTLPFLPDPDGSSCTSGSSAASPGPVPIRLIGAQRKPQVRHRLFLPRNDGPLSDPGSVDEPPTLSGPSKTVWDEEWPNHRIDNHAKADLPRAVDFAYAQTLPPTLPVESSVDHGINPGLANQQRRPTPLRTGTTERQRVIVPPPEPIQPRNGLEDHPVSAQQTIVPIMINGGNYEEPKSPAERPDDRDDQSPASGPLSVVPRSERPSSNWGRDKYDERDYAMTTNELKGKHHLTLKEGQQFSLQHGHKRQPIARNWSVPRKRFVATVTCLNTALIGVLIGIYAGEVPAIQYTLADLHHQVIMGNVYLYIGMAITTFFFWPLPLLHGRKPYTLLALGIALPLQIPQAVIVQSRRSPTYEYGGYMTGLLLSRGLLGLALGFAHLNSKATLLDLYGASLQSEFPHGEVVITDDVRRHGGGMGYWLGIWSFSFLGSLALGFLVGADVISGLEPAWGFYICAMLVALALFINVMTPETRRSPHRRTMQEVELPNDSISRRVARGEIRMHVTGDGPKWWWEEVFSGIYLSFRMLTQSGFFVMTLYMAWIYAQIVLIIVLLGNLLSAEYAFKPEYVGLGVVSVCVGAILAVPNSKANFFSRSRVNPQRTDSMTLQPRFGWSSHLVRRASFMTVLPAAGLAYTLASAGSQVQYMVPIVFATVIGYISNLAMAECNGIIMETFDTSDLQPGTNSRHRLQSLSVATQRRRTTYTSYPRVSAGLCTAQALGFLFAAAATGVGGAVTRTVGAQKATAITAGILLFLTMLLTCSLLRFRVVQVIPNELFGHYFGSSNADRRRSAASGESDKSWRAVVIGNPSGKNRRMNWLELGSLSRWTEIRRLNRLLNRSTTQALNPGWQ